MAGQRRAFGPYRHGRRFRIVIRGPGGQQTYASYDTEEEATAVRDKFNQQLEGVTVADAIDEYEQHLRAKGNRESSIRTTLHRLRVLGDIRTFRGCTRSAIESRLSGMSSSVDTRKNTLGQWRTFLCWCQQQGYIKRDPSAGLKVEGRRRRGKPQLRIDEARRLAAFCEVAAHAGDASATGTLLALLMGFRASELCNLTVRDLDDGGNVLWVARAKTVSGVRRCEVPEVLRDILLAHAAGREHDTRLIGLSRYALHYHCKRLCREAGVPEVTPHGLRGTHASIVAEQGVTGHVAAKALGHSSYQVTERHYVDADAAQRGRQERVLKVLAGGKK